MGEKLGVLDVLANSTSFACAILAQVSLRSLSVIGCVFAAVWALSPVGGQASLRIMTIGRTTVADPASFDYLSMVNSYDDWLYASKAESTTTGLYLAALTAPQRIKDSPMDLWDNVKIPILEDIPGWTDDASTKGTWLNVPSQNVSYASLVGLPVSGLVSGADFTELKLETSYWRLDCPLVQRGDICDLLTADSFPTDDSPPMYNVSANDGITPVAPPGNRCTRTDWVGHTLALASFVYTNSSGSGGAGRQCAANQTFVPARNLIYSGWPMYGAAKADSERFSAFCTMTTSWVEVQVRCHRQECAVSRVRRSQLPHPPTGWTSLDDEDCIYFNYFIDWFIRVADASGSASGALPQGYLAYPNAPSLALHGLVNATHPGDLEPAVFGLRLGQLLNTWWILSIGRDLVSSGVDVGKVGRVGDDVFPRYRLQLNTTSGMLTHDVAIISCSTGWFVALAVVSAVMIAASAVPLMLRFRTRTPAFSLLVSTMVKDSPYFEGSGTGSTLESSDRSRLLRHRMVRLGDVAPNDAVGYLAVGSLDGDSSSVGRVRKGQEGRLYR